MTLVRFEPMRELESFQGRLMRYFDDFPAFGFRAGENFSPKIDISENEKSILIDAEIPGVKKEDIKVILNDNILTIEGEKKKVDEQKEKTYYRCERSHGLFKRSFTLPVKVNSEKVQAKFDNGMLHIEIEKFNKTVINEKLIQVK